MWTRISRSKPSAIPNIAHSLVFLQHGVAIDSLLCIPGIPISVTPILGIVDERKIDLAVKVLLAALLHTLGYMRSGFNFIVR
jgi:hypothetical protein